MMVIQQFSGIRIGWFRYPVHCKAYMQDLKSQWSFSSASDSKIPSKVQFNSTQLPCFEWQAWKTLLWEQSESEVSSDWLKMCTNRISNSLSVIKIVFTIIAIFVMKRWGRKNFMYLSLSGMGASALIVARMGFQKLKKQGLDFLSRLQDLQGRFDSITNLI